MTRALNTDSVWSIDDLELELRKLPGVRAAGFDDCDDMLLVQLHVADDPERSTHSDRPKQPLPVSASRIAARHSDRPVAVEVVRWRTAPIAAPYIAPLAAAATATETHVHDRIIVEGVPERSRARLLAVLAFPDTDELEVHLILDGQRTIGRAPASSGIEGAAEATIAAVRDLGADINARVRWARALDDDGHADQIAVAVSLEDVDDRSPLHYGLAAGASLIDAAARATLDALNRHLTREV